MSDKIENDAEKWVRPFTCVKHNIEVSKMSDMFLNQGRKRRKAQ